MADNSSSTCSSDKSVASDLQAKPHQEGDVKDHDESPDCLCLDITKLSLTDLGKEIDSTLKVKTKKKLLVFDLNGLLIHRAHKYCNTANIPKSRPSDATFRNHLIYRRPFCSEFLRFCMEKFEVAIWSSAMEHNVAGVLNLVAGDIKAKLLFVWDQKYCSDYGFMCLEKSTKPMFFKELQKVWETHKNSDKGPFSASNTLLIDDKPYKGLLNPVNTAIYTSSYDVEDLNDDALDPKGLLGQYLVSLAEADDVASYVESHPFGQPAIKQGHPEWDFYSEVLLAISGK